MIFDLTQIILQLSTAYTKVTYETFVNKGTTYKKSSSSSTINGILVPLTSDERIELQGLGHAIEGKMNFYCPVNQGRLTENDSIFDKLGVEWVVEPYNSDYSDVANVIKYRLSRQVL